MRRDAVQMRQKLITKQSTQSDCKPDDISSHAKTAQNQEINTSKFQRLQLFFNTIQRCSLNWQIKSK